MQIEDAFLKAKEEMKSDQNASKKSFEYVISLLENTPLDKLSSYELRIFALSNMNLFLISQFNDVARAEQAIKAFEKFFEKDTTDVEAYEGYILTLELMYQYEKSKLTLMELLNHEQTKVVALKFLSSYVYCAEGLQSADDCMAYKQELLDITADMC